MSYIRCVRFQFLTNFTKQFFISTNLEFHIHKQKNNTRRQRKTMSKRIRSSSDDDDGEHQDIGKRRPKRIKFGNNDLQSK